jgi:predicted phage terminase large subunit-like protein
MVPRNRKDQRFRDAYFRYHTKEEIRKGKYTFYTAVDPTSTSTGDGKAVITIGVGTRENGNLHMPVVKADIQQESIDWMLETSWRHYELFKMKVLGVEENSYKDFVKREYLRLMGKKKQPLPFKPIQQSGSKIERIDTLVFMVKEGIMTFDLEDPDQDTLIKQLKAHPTPGSISSGGLGDDGPDALATAKQLVDEYPPGSDGTGYETLQKRVAIFEKGSW